MPYKTCDISNIKNIKQLPVFNKGCDSSYSWAKKFKHLATNKNIQQTVNELETNLPTGKFLHSLSKQNTHFCITGGEPLLQQNIIIELIKEFKKRNNLPKFITIETNGTQKLTENFKNFFEEYINEEMNYFFCISKIIFNIWRIIQKSYKT